MRDCFASFVLGLAIVAQATAADWPQWRGPNRDGVSSEKGLLAEWPAGGPAQHWKASGIGEGYSTPSIAKGRVYVQTTRGDEEFTLAFDEKDGRKIWDVKIGKVGQNRGPQYPGTRSTPTIDGERIYSLASDGELVCLAAADGKQLWQKHLRNDFGGKPGSWAYTESVLIDGEAVICTPGSTTAALAALNKLTGNVIWKTAITEEDNAEYASIVAVDPGARKEYVQFLRKGLVGVDAQTGEFLWRYSRTIDPGANILTPLVFGNRIFSAGARTGGGVIEIQGDGKGVKASELYFFPALSPSIGGAVLVDGHVYGANMQALFCADFATGKVHWTERALGPASICFADGRLYVRGFDTGEVLLVDPSPDGYREKGRLKPSDRSNKKAWTHPVVANGHLYLRDQETLMAYDVSASSGRQAK